MRLSLPNDLLKRGDDTDLSDLTDAERTGEQYWDPDEVDVLVVPMDAEPTPAEEEAIRRRLVTTDANDEANLADLLTAANDPGAPLWARLTLRAELARYGETTEGA